MAVFPNARTLALAPAISGLKEAAAAFKKVEPTLRARLNEAIEDTAIALAREARGSVPVDTGILREHLGWSMSRATGRGRVGLRKGVVLIFGNGIDLPGQPCVYVNAAHFLKIGAFAGGNLNNAW